MGEQDAQRWDARYANGSHAGPPDPYVLEHARHLPRESRIVDVAGGTGRHARALAALGHKVAVLDISGVALQQIAASGLSVELVQVDLEEQGMPAGRWDALVCTQYLHRPLFPQFARVLVPGGLLIMVHPTVRNLERHPRPSARFLLDESELAGLLQGWELLDYQEGWGKDGQCQARAVARPPRLSPPEA